MSPMYDGNALKQASMPAWKHLLETYPAALLDASGTAVGLPSYAGGSPEAGHRTIGLGKPWKTSEARVEAGLAEASTRANTLLRKKFVRMAKRGGALHLIGLLSSDSSYANERYVEALATRAKDAGFAKIYIHVILDGIDAPRDNGLKVVRAFEARLREAQCGEIVSICGRMWGMDHDGYWDRTERAFRAMAFGSADRTATSPEEAIRSSYDEGVWDDRMEPTVIASRTSHHVLADGDVVLFWNMRPYGIRQLLKFFSLPVVPSIDRSDLPDISCFSLVEYDYDLPVEVLFPCEQSRMSIGCVLSRSGLRQLRIAEAERFAHITVFLNGMHEGAWPGEDRQIVSSPAVSSYEHAPAMAMEEVTDHAIKAIASGTYDAIMCNLCAPDIAASTGSEATAVQACEAMDRRLARLVEGTLAVGGVLIAVGDSGHVETLRDPFTNEINKHPTSNPVPCVIVGSAYEGLKSVFGDLTTGDSTRLKSSGTLADVAPTMLHILSLPIPKEMIGKSLI